MPDEHLFVVLQGAPGQEDLEIPWSEWAAWQRAQIFREYREQKHRAARATSAGQARKGPAVATSSGGADPADDLYGSVEPEPPEAA
jgi:hypothetical protein